MAQPPINPSPANVHQRVYSKSEEPGFIFGCHYENCRKISKRKYCINAHYAKKHGNIGHELFKKMTREETLAWAGARRLAQSEKIVTRRETKESKRRAHRKAWITRRGSGYVAGHLIVGNIIAGQNLGAVTQPTAHDGDDSDDEANSLSDEEMGDATFAEIEDSGVDLGSQLQNELDKRRSSSAQETASARSGTPPVNISSIARTTSQIIDPALFEGSGWSPGRIQRIIAASIDWDPLGHLKTDDQFQTLQSSNISDSASRANLTQDNAQTSSSSGYDPYNDEDDSDEFDENENIDDFAERRERERARNGAKG